MRKHLAIFTNGLAEKILKGEKTIEIRFSTAKIAPFGVISKGDLVYIKPSGKDIVGQFKVKKVIFYDSLDDSDLDQIKKTFGADIAQPETFWLSKKDSKYATLVFIGECDPFLTSPIKIKKKDLRGWVVLG